MAYEPKWLKDLRKLRGGARVIAKYQKPKAEGEGERQPDFVHVTGNEYFRLDVPKPRAYVKCVGPQQDGHDWPDDMGGACVRCGGARDSLVGECVPVSWWYCDPLGHWGRLATAVVVEHADSTISVAGTINNHGPYEPWWRGTLLKGVWDGKAIYPEQSLAVE